MKELIDDLPRELTLLRAAYQLLKKQEQSGYVLNLIAETTVWDGVECDGNCLMEEAETLLIELDINPDFQEESE